ncbi:MAG: tyrosine-type recombinase/integrase [Candidatus Binatia bacterium]
MSNKRSLTPTVSGLTVAQFSDLSAVPPEMEWFANIDNGNTRKAYECDVKEFMAFAGVTTPEVLRQVTRAHVIAWRNVLASRMCASSTIRRKLAALSSLFRKLCEENVVLLNPVDGVKRPKMTTREGVTPALSAEQTRRLLEAPRAETLKGKRDRALLSTLAHHALRREEVCKLTVGDLQMRHGVMHLRVEGKGSKVRYIPIHPETQRLLSVYLDACGHRDDVSGALFRPVKNYVTGNLRKPLHPESVLQEIILKYGRMVGITESVRGFCVHSLRATAATNALANGADIAKVQDWMGHANVATTRLYDHRQHRPEESPTFHIRY